MKRRTRDRLLLPILLPIGILAAMIGLMLLFSRILLNTSAEAATVVALIVSIAILAGAGVLASRGRFAGASLGSLLGVVAGVAMLAGGIALAVAEPGEEKPEGGEPFAASIAAPPGAVTEGFSTDLLALPPDRPVKLAFENQDAATHNVTILEADPQEQPGPPVLFAGSDVAAGVSTSYEVDPLSEGDFFFFCSIHPTTMTGTVEVSEEAAAGGGEGGAQIAAQNIQFDTDELTFVAEMPTTLAFDNLDAGTPHNVAIYEDDSLSGELFRGEIITGQDTIDYEVPGLPAGEFYFLCEVHPVMNGTVLVEKGVGGDGGGDGGPPEPAPTESPPPEEGGGAAATVAVMAEGIQFDTAEISLSAGSETAFTLDNRDTVPHNLTIYSGEDPLFTFEPFTGPAAKEFTIPPLEAGEYSFHCDVHPTMAGTVAVA